MPAPEENETVAAFIKGRGDPDADKAPEKMDTEGPAAQNIRMVFTGNRDLGLKCFSWDYSLILAC